MNNPLLYGAAIAGFMAQARCPIGMPSSVYASLETAAQAFASAVDADIPTDLAISDSKVNAMSLIVAAAMTGAYQTDPNQADYTALAQGVVALYNAAVTAGVPSSSAPNVVSITNAGGLNAANPLVFSAPAITRKGSGYFKVSASACPVLGGRRRNRHDVHVMARLRTAESVSIANGRTGYRSQDSSSWRWTGRGRRNWAVRGYCCGYDTAYLLARDEQYCRPEHDR